MKTKEQVFETLLENYLSITAKHIKETPEQTLVIMNDVREAWRKLYRNADDNINTRLKKRI